MKTSLKTYSHLMAARRMPSEYDLVTSKLHYYVTRGFEVETPLAGWYRRYQQASPLSCENWDDFRDPRETTYSKYTALQREKEAHVDGILRSISGSDYDARLAPAWLERLERLLSPARFVFHGLQMAAAYVGQMGPSGRITIAGALQTADEMRRVQRFAYRMAMLKLLRDDFGDGGKKQWLEDPSFQPLRRAIEELLCSYDWGEALCALNLCVKPVVDELFLTELSERSKAEGDYLFGQICFSLGEDCAWHRSWTEALLKHAIAARAENAAVVAGFIEQWLPRAERAAEALGPSLGEGAAGRAAASVRRWHRTMGLLP
jgi:toluene monooxygenase system protein E